MQRLPILLLGLSLVANAALVWKLADSQSQSAALSAETANPERSRDPHSPKLKSTDVASLAALRTATPAELVAQLRAAGVDEALIKTILLARLRSDRGSQLASLDDSAKDRATWWRTPSNNTPEKKARAEQRQALEDDIRKDASALLGTAAAPANSGDPRYAFLSAEKIAAIKQIEKDYQTLSANNPKFAGMDRENRQLIESEKLADIATVLTPHELAEYELRFSRTAEQMRSRVSTIEASEAEYRALFKLHQPFEASYDNRTLRTPDQHAAATAASARLQADIVAQLGAERGGDYIWFSDQDYQNLKQISQSAALPSDTALNMMRLREAIGAQGMEITRQSLSSAEKLTALIALSATAQQQVNALIPTGVQANLPPRTVAWISELATGRVRTADPILRYSSSTNVSATPRMQLPRN
ncbi:hypothetical protein [Oleiharenicola lentus]|uniref:hypothetical protein n=1 Tax=Oleiharenicola lentus TaxID=2508720 RepID=UPI003F678750